MGVLFAPVLLVVFCLIFVFGIVSSSFSAISQGGTVQYDENALQDHAAAQYDAAFAASGAYEDGLLITFLVEEDDYYDYQYMAWTGYHIRSDVRELFGNNTTALGQTIASHINAASYKHSLDNNLADAVDDLRGQIAAMGGDMYTCEEDRTALPSRLLNRTNIAMSEETVNASLRRFTEETGIPLVLVVENSNAVLPTQYPVGAVVSLVLFIVVAVLVVVLLVRRYNRRQETDSYDSGYGR